jgi:CheY-like chemotaxis protein
MDNGSLVKQPRCRALVIEDHRDFAQLLCDILEIQGCAAQSVFDAQEGLNAARATVPDMIFCDIGLPGTMNGHDFARQLRSEPGLAHIPLVAVSGYTSEQDKSRAIEAGFNLVFAKPVKFADLTLALDTYFPLENMRARNLVRSPS